MATTRPHLNPTRWPSQPRYIPLDELLKMPRVRILRVLLHFDWTSCEDINLALDNLEEREANTYSACLGRMVREGFVEKKVVWRRRLSRATRRNDWNWSRYRITAAGRKHLDDLLGRAQVNEVAR